MDEVVESLIGPEEQTIIKKRKQIAMDENLFEKGKTIARHLGIQVGKDGFHKHNYSTDDFIYISEKSGLVIENEKSGENKGDTYDGYDKVSVRDDGRLVYEGRFFRFIGKEYLRSIEKEPSVDVTAYVPGNWKEEFERLYGKAETIQQKKIKQDSDEMIRKQREKQKEILRRFGLYS